MRDSPNVGCTFVDITGDGDFTGVIEHKRCSRKLDTREAEGRGAKLVNLISTSGEVAVSCIVTKVGTCEVKCLAREEITASLYTVQTGVQTYVRDGSGPRLLHIVHKMLTAEQERPTAPLAFSSEKHDGQYPFD